MSIRRHSETAFETVIEEHLLQNGYVPVAGEGFDRGRAIFPKTVLAFIRETQPKEWARPEVLHGAKTGERVLGDFCRWIDSNGVHTIALIKERCSALTAAAVTGQVDMEQTARKSPRSSWPASA